MTLPHYVPVDTGVDIHAPFATLHHSHEAIVSQLGQLDQLPQLVASMQQARELAARTLELFNGEVLRHHQDEERELFPAVLRAVPEADKSAVASTIQRLLAEHRAIERIWRGLEPVLKEVARGRPEPLDAGAVALLVRLYEQHASFEEQHFLPLAQQVLGRDERELTALGMALHIRRLPTITGHI